MPETWKTSSSSIESKHLPTPSPGSHDCPNGINKDSEPPDLQTYDLPNTFRDLQILHKATYSYDGIYRQKNVDLTPRS